MGAFSGLKIYSCTNKQGLFWQIFHSFPLSSWTFTGTCWPSMSFEGNFHDPLSINLRRQTRFIISKLPSSSPYSLALLNSSSYSVLLATLSDLLTVPSLTLCIAELFRPILFNLCACWLQTEDPTEAQLVAICLLLEPHEELFP
jgi:midasin